MIWQIVILVILVIGIVGAGMVEEAEKADLKRRVEALEAEANRDPAFRNRLRR